MDQRTEAECAIDAALHLIMQRAMTDPDGHVAAETVGEVVAALASTLGKTIALAGCADPGVMNKILADCQQHIAAIATETASLMNAVMGPGYHPKGH